MNVPVPERVYDAAMRYVCREPLPDDVNILEAWYKGERPLTYREMALEALRLAFENGIDVPNGARA